MIKIDIQCIAFRPYKKRVVPAARMFAQFPKVQKKLPRQDFKKKRSTHPPKVANKWYTICEQIRKPQKLTHMILETKRLCIHTLSETDWQVMKNMFIDFSHSKYAVYDQPLPTEDVKAKALVKKFAESKRFFMVFTKESNDPIGYICFHNNKPVYDLGYCFHSAYHSKGYAYESIWALIQYFADEYGATGFTAGTALDNVLSCRLLKKLGFVCVSTESISFDSVFSFQGGNFMLNVK